MNLFGRNKKTKEGGTEHGRRDALGMGVWFLVYFAALLFWELYLHAKIYGSLSDVTPWLLIFIPAEAMLLTALSGWSGKKVVRRLIGMLLIFAVGAFYIAQLFYYRVFGTCFSVAMIGMGGDALENFGWTLTSVLKESIVVMLISFLPIVLAAVGLIFIKKEFSYRAWLHLPAALCAVLLWLLAVALLPLGGTEGYSAYAAYHSDLVDTATAAGKIGVLTNSALEAKSVLFGAAGEGSDSESDGRTALESTGVTSLTGKNTIEAGQEESEEDLGPQYNVIEELDFAALAESTDDATLKELCNYFASQTGTEKNDMTGYFEGYNLIYICAESFSSLAIDETVTPTLYKLANEGIILTNYYNSFKNTTTNGEYAMICSLWPDVSRSAKMGTSVGSFPQSADNYMPLGIGTLFAQQYGVHARGYHNYLGSYYNRRNSLTNLGLDCRFKEDGMKFSSSWPASDLEMMEQTVDDYINDDQFVAYYMTFSGHGSYSESNAIYNKNISFVEQNTKGRGYTYTAKGYLACNRELDLALEYLLERLEEAGKLENTVIVMAGDHYPYYLDDTSYAKLLGHSAEQSFEAYENTCIIWCGGMEEPIVVDTPCCNVDILPTVLNLFGVEYDSRLLAGTDIFSSGTHVATIYNRSFVTDSVKYNSSNGKAEWLIDTSEYTEEQLQEYLSSMISYVNTKYSLSLKIADTDFYKFAWVNSGIVTEDEIEVMKVEGYTGGGTAKKTDTEETPEDSTEDGTGTDTGEGTGGTGTGETGGTGTGEGTGTGGGTGTGTDTGETDATGTGETGGTGEGTGTGTGTGETGGTETGGTETGGAGTGGDSGSSGGSDGGNAGTGDSGTSGQSAEAPQE